MFINKLQIFRQINTNLNKFINKDSLYFLFGYIFFIGLMSGGYYYNLTFVQLGLIDLGTNFLGLDRLIVSKIMALFAILTIIFSFSSSYYIYKRGWNNNLKIKLKLLFLILVIQTSLTFLVLLINNIVGLIFWIIFCSFSIGLGIPVTFSLVIDFIKVRHRGYVAAIITAAAFFIANIYPIVWNIHNFSKSMLLFLIPGTIFIGFLAFRQNNFILYTSNNYKKKEYSLGKFNTENKNKNKNNNYFIFFILLMFAIFFIDSLGFLKIIETKYFAQASWKSAELNVHLILGISHIISAIIAGVIYSNFNKKHIFYWIFFIFAITHLMYYMQSMTISSNSPTLMMSIMYTIAVSFYTVVNFALWSDFSNSNNVMKIVTIGVGISGWFATFLSTSLYIYLEYLNISFEQHLRIVNSLSLLLLLSLSIIAYLEKGGFLFNRK